MISLQNATRLALWLAANHPQAFRQIAWQLRAAPERARSGGLGRFGDLSDPVLQDIPVEVDSIAPIAEVASNSAFDWSRFNEPILSDLNVSEVGSATPPNFDVQSTAASGDSSGFWGSIGSAFSGAGSVIATVARSLTNPQVLASAGNLTATVIKSNAQTQLANAQQQAVLATQLARVGNNVSPAPIQYATAPTGASVPVLYDPTTGQYRPVTAPALSSLIPSSVPAWLGYALAGTLLLTLLLSRSASS